MMTPVDLGLAAAGRLAAAVERRAGSRRATWVVVLGLVTLSAVPTILIGSSRRPTDLSFDDVRSDRIPAMTSWVRLEGELRPYPGSISLYELHDTANDALYVIVIADAPLQTGHAILTGRLSPAEAVTGNIGSIHVDIPAVPKRNEPFAIILLPAALAGVIVAGGRIGYPVVRRERPRLRRAPPLSAEESLHARWSGRIGSELVAHLDARPCTVTVIRKPDVSEVSLRDGDEPRTVRARRAVPATPIRVCRTGGCRSGLEIHAQTADLVLTFADRQERDRLATTLA